ncbi:MAG: hypothetical protein ABI995_02715 [Acidobacteriota bacterium]
MDVQKQIDFLVQNQASHDAKIGKLIELQTKNELMLADLMSAVISHERRISNMEGRA